MTPIYRAQAMGSEVVPDLRLVTTNAVPEEQVPIGSWEAAARTFYREQASMIADALWASLPGGTLDALLVVMLDRKASLLRIPHRKVE